MAELIAVIFEAVFGLITALFQALPAILETLAYIFMASVLTVAYVVSPRFREKKHKEWADKPGKKYLELGISGTCLVLLISLVVWITWPTPEPPIKSQTIQVKESGADEDVRFRISTTPAGGTTNQVTVEVKKGGARKILGTESLEQLGQAIRENVSVVDSAKKLQREGARPGSKPTHAETNRTSSATESRR